MTREDIIAMAQEAGFGGGGFVMPTHAGHITHELERFATLVAQHEIEKCAKLCDDLDQKLWEDMGEPMSGYGEAIREMT